MKITPEELYSKLVDEFKIFEKKGNIFFELGNIDIVVKRRDVVGSIIQEWLYEWLRRNDIEFEQDDSQLPPDLFLDPENKTNNLVEVKAFNSDATPAFDISDPITFLTDITKRPYMLHTKYLIFAYKMDENTGVVTVENLWLKNIWEICAPSKKQGLPTGGNAIKIRPTKWFDKTKRATPNFLSLEHFLSGFVELIYFLYNANSKHNQLARNAKSDIIESYKKFYGKTITIEWFDAIKSEYFKD